MITKQQILKECERLSAEYKKPLKNVLRDFREYLDSETIEAKYKRDRAIFEKCISIASQKWTEVTKQEYEVISRGAYFSELHVRIENEIIRLNSIPF